MIIGTYIRRLYFNAETGQTAFLFRTDTNKCMKVVGKYCLQQEGFPLAIDGTFKNTEYDEGRTGAFGSGCKSNLQLFLL